MMTAQAEILARIPHRPPFLWIDRIVTREATAITTEATIASDLEIFAGHYPGRPVMPGVLLCEAIFQSGALLMSYLLEEAPLPCQGVPVLARIDNARFKRMVAPGDQIQIKVTLKETIGKVSFMKGTLRVAGKVAVQTSFSVTLAAAP
ncbi:MAG: 3-hydroxyacyl-ACP dehydratase FabZ family protein [Desulfopila sp.]